MPTTAADLLEGPENLEDFVMGCPVCRARQIVEIAVNLSGRTVTLHSCSKCDTRWWDDEAGEVVELRDVIDLATVRR